MDNDQTLSQDQRSTPWGLRVRELRIAAGLTQDEVAERVGSTKATISKIERSTNPPKLEWIEKLARAFDVDVASLALGEGRGEAQVRPTMIPVIGMISAGNWREAVNSPEGFVPVIQPNSHMFALRVAGDSIDRIAPDGSYVAIDPTNPSLDDGSVYAVQNADGETTLKRFRRAPDRLEPVSTNAIHKPIILGKEAITIVGRATQVIQML